MPAFVRRCVTLASTLFVTAACYHATIETGAKPSDTVIQKDWASGWVYGLVPPDVVASASKCPNGVAKVETQLSFLNQLVGFLTLEIYTPMSIKVTCAATGTADASHIAPDVSVAATDGQDAVNAAFQAAVNRSSETHTPVVVQVK